MTVLYSYLTINTLEAETMYKYTIERSRWFIFAINKNILSLLLFDKITYY